METVHGGYSGGICACGEDIDMRMVVAKFQQSRNCHAGYESLWPDRAPTPAAISCRLSWFDEKCVVAFKLEVVAFEAVPLTQIRII